MLRFQEVIFVQKTDGETITLVVKDLDTTTIEDLKRMIDNRFQIALNEQHLFLKDSDDEELEDGGKLSDHGIRSNSTLYLKVGISNLPSLTHFLTAFPTDSLPSTEESE